jgi:tripartite-type tricarboxylate transporter receptor subunit TctC
MGIMNAKVRAPGLLLALAAAAVPLATSAQQWPTHTVHIIATSPPGGSVDFLARALAEDFSRSFGAPFVVESRPGANGNIGVDLVVKAPPDGHMLFVAPPGPFSINANLMSFMPFNPEADIAPVAMLGIAPLLLVVHPSVPAKNLRELLAWMRGEGAQAHYASQAVASSGHLAMELLKSLAGVDALHVPYKGSAAQATTDLLAGRVAMSFVNTSTALQHVRDGRLRAIAVAELKRIDAAPEIPTLSESGLPGFEATPWLGLGARSGTSRGIIHRLNDRSSRALAHAEVARRMANLGIEARPMTPEEFAGFVHAETEKWAGIIRRSGAKVE